jgi:pilus assembly protein Flp/PilA
MKKLFQKIRNRRAQRKGQGMTEYIIIVALIAIATIAVVTLFGDNLRQLFGASANALAGNTSNANTGKNATGATNSRNVANFGQNLDTY